MNAIIKLRFEGNTLKGILREPFTIERLLNKAALILRIPLDQVTASYQPVFVDSD